ncbi:PadR family transcriptional regulator [Heliobacterium undosum]|uniref:PadR family transcriptional regulator n=1 Tax=Heliomicrobium undosum TaxID=121734 RepID=A0A845L8C4_9FIRM|nr:PadR family transcriptional regulator [Heliomicrobium undosum]MZP31044.1 PadR family transcriptional regulator [Heliomicrobium undosum]
MNVNKELLKGSTVTMILSLVDRQPMYGYEMIKELEKLSDGVFAFKEGTLYPILHALESEGLVESFWMGEEGARRRKYYRITGAGKTRLKEKRAEWILFSSSVNRIIGEGIL